MANDVAGGAGALIRGFLDSLEKQQENARLERRGEVNDAYMQAMTDRINQSSELMPQEAMSRLGMPGVQMTTAQFSAFSDAMNAKRRATIDERTASNSLKDADRVAKTLEQRDRDLRKNLANLIKAKAANPMSAIDSTEIDEEIDATRLELARNRDNAIKLGVTWLGEAPQVVIPAPVIHEQKTEPKGFMGLLKNILAGDGGQ